MNVYRTFLVGLLIACAGVAPVLAQVADTTKGLPADTTRVVPDSLFARPDSLSFGRGPAPDSIVARPLIAFPQPDSGYVPLDSLPPRMPALDAAGLLADNRGSFVYDFGALGWPDGWSPYAMTPSQVVLYLDGRPFTDDITGRPFLEMLPLAFLNPLALAPGRGGNPLAVEASLRSFDVLRPLSEVRFRSGQTGLQSVWVSHSQRRRLRMFGQRGVWGFTLGYGGHGANNEYDGSKLSRTRQFLTRFRFRTPHWAVEISNLNNRRKIGAHAGVQPSGSIYETIYNRFSAQVLNPGAKRENLRNDLGVNLYTRLIPGLDEPLHLGGYWTDLRFSYWNVGDTLRARTSRLGYRVQQDIPAGDLTLFGRAEGYRETIIDATALPDSLGLKRTSTSLETGLFYRNGALDVRAHGGYYRMSNLSFASGTVRAELRGDVGYVFVEASQSGEDYAWIEQYGWGDLIAGPVKHIGLYNRFQMLRAGAGLRLGVLTLDVEGFAQETEDHVDLYETAVSDTLSLMRSELPVRWAGASGTLGFRKDNDRGLYLMVTPTLYRMRDASASELLSRQAQTLPELYIRARSGLRYLLFRGDFDMDLYVQGRSWSAFNSRVLHPQTGRLVVPLIDARPIEASAALDVVMEVGVRTAKLFLSFENILSGTSLIIGNQLVPNFPLPERRFRFGVFWPISG